MLILKVLRIFCVAAYLFFFGCVATALKPFGSKRIEELKQKGRELNTNAAKKIGASSLFVTLANGIKLHVVEAGDKRSKKMIVLLHGFPDTWHCWSGVIPDLVKEGYFVVAPDMRGYNLSEKPKSCNDYRINVLINDVKELIESYGKKSCNVAGHDWGGVVAWNLVDRHPEVVDKLVILNAPYTKAYQHVVRKNINQMLSSWYILFFQIPFIPVNLISYFPDQAAKTFIKTRREGKVSKEDYELLASAYAQENASMSMLYYYKAMVRGEVSNALKKRSQPKRERREAPEKIKVPSLILWGQNDVALVSELAMCARWVEKLQVIYIPDCSHWVPYEVPEIISREIIKFIA